MASTEQQLQMLHDTVSQLQGHLTVSTTEVTNLKTMFDNTVRILRSEMEADRRDHG